MPSPDAVRGGLGGGLCSAGAVEASRSPEPAHSLWCGVRGLGDPPSAQVKGVRRSKGEQRVKPFLHPGGLPTNRRPHSGEAGFKGPSVKEGDNHQEIRVPGRGGKRCCQLPRVLSRPSSLL